MVKCTRCGRTLKHPKWKNGEPYGRVCVTKVQVVSPEYQEELKALKMQFRELKMELRQLKINGHITTRSPPSGGQLPKVPGSPGGGNGHGNPLPLGMNYGDDHGELMKELKSVLSSRTCA